MSRYEDRLNDYKRRQNADQLTFHHINELIAAHGKMHNQWLYTNIDRWNQDPVHTPVYYLNEEWMYELEEEQQAVHNDSGELIPGWLANENIQTWFEFATFEDVIDVLKDSGHPVSIPMVIMGLKHYYEYDAFLDYDQAEAIIRFRNVLQALITSKNE